MNEFPAQGKILTCTGCSLLCSDILADFDGSNFRFANACGKGEAYLNALSRASDRNVTVDGKESLLDDAMARIVAELNQARMPLICGLADQSVETQVAAIELARQASAAIDWTSDISPFAWHASLQQVGRVSCSISEMSHSADLVVVWSADPDSSHPRLFESYSGEVVVIDSDSSATSHRAIRNFVWSKNQQQSALRYFREQLAGISVDEDLSDESFGEQMSWLEQKLVSARYPVFVVDDRFAETHGNVGAMGLALYVRALNKHNHCRLVCLSRDSHSRGAFESFTSQTGAPFGVLFRKQEPLFRGRDASAAELIRSVTLDLIVVIGHEIPATLEKSILASSAAKICIGSAIADAVVLVPTRQWGIHENGSGIATDGTPVRADLYCESAQTSPTEFINAIRLQLKQVSEVAAR